MVHFSASAVLATGRCSLVSALASERYDLPYLKVGSDQIPNILAMALPKDITLVMLLRRATPHASSTDSE
jgi:hypothetical protein